MQWGGTVHTTANLVLNKTTQERLIEHNSNKQLEWEERDLCVCGNTWGSLELRMGNMRRWRLVFDTSTLLPPLTSETKLRFITGKSLIGDEILCLSLGDVLNNVVVCKVMLPEIDIAVSSSLEFQQVSWVSWPQPYVFNTAVFLLDSEVIAYGSKDGLLLFLNAFCQSKPRLIAAYRLPHSILSLSRSSEYCLKAYGPFSTVVLKRTVIPESTEFEADSFKVLDGGHLSSVKSGKLVGYISQNPESQNRESISKLVRVTLKLGKDGKIGLKLVGSQSRGGCWIQSAPTTNGGSELVGNEALLSVNDIDVSDKTLDDVVDNIFSNLRPFSEVSLTLARIDYDMAFGLLTALVDAYFSCFEEEEPSESSVYALFQSREWEESECILEYALRNQAIHGNIVDNDIASPPWLDFEARAKQNGWKELEGQSREEAQVRYVRYILGNLRDWKPHDCWETIRSILSSSSNCSQRTPPSLKNAPKVQSTAKTDLVMTPLQTPQGIASCNNMYGNGGLLFSRDTFHFVGIARSDPTCLQWQHMRIPKSYFDVGGSLKLVSQSPDGLTIAVTGARGLLLYNRRSEAWKRFGSALDESEWECEVLFWLTADIIVTVGLDHSISERQIRFYLKTHLDSASILHCESIKNGVSYIDKSSDGLRLYCMMMCSKNKRSNEIFVFDIEIKKALADTKIKVKLQSELTVLWDEDFYGPFVGFMVVPRLKKVTSSSSYNSNDANVSGGFSIWARNESKSHEKAPLPRFGFLDSNSTLWIHDATCKISTQVATNVKKVIPMFDQSLMVPLQESYVLSTTDNVLKLWVPSLDGALWTTPTNKVAMGSPEWVNCAIDTFCRCQDPERLETELSRLENLLKTGPVKPVDHLRSLLSEYGIPLLSISEKELFAEASCSFTSTLDLKGCSEALDPDVMTLAIDPRLKVLVGTSSDAFCPLSERKTKVLSSPWNAFHLQIQPIVTLMLRMVFHLGADQWIKTLIGHYSISALGTIAIERFLYATLENTYSGLCEASTLVNALNTVKPLRNFKECLVNLARTVEPNRLPLLFPAAGKPILLFKEALDEKEFETAAKFLLLLGTEGMPAFLHESLNVESTQQQVLQCARHLLSLSLDASGDEFALSSQIIRFIQRLSGSHYQNDAVVIHLLSQRATVAMNALELQTVALITEWGGKLQVELLSHNVKNQNSDEILIILQELYHMQNISQWHQVASVEIGADSVYNQRQLVLKDVRFYRKHRCELVSLLEAFKQASLKFWVSSVQSLLEIADEAIDKIQDI